MVAAAHDYGFTVAAHAHGAEAIRRAVIGGVDSIEHGTYMDDCRHETDEATRHLVRADHHRRQIREEKAKEGWFPPQVAAQGLKKSGRSSRRPPGRAYKAGVKIAFGTDAGVYPHGENASEFVYMVQAGMPRDVRHPGRNHACGRSCSSTTRTSAALRPGKFADVIAVHGNPLDDIACCSTSIS